MNDLLIINSENFKKLKNRFNLDGKEKLHILSDFDRTLTKDSYNGKKLGSIISNLRNGNYLSKEYAKKAHELYNHYRKIEIDPNIPLTEKKEKMYEWWMTHKVLLIDEKLNKKAINDCVDEMIQTNSLVLREGFEDLFKILKEKGIPIIILTSSLKDLVQTYLEKKSLFSENVHVIGNEFEYNNEGTAIKILKIITLLSKNEAEINDTLIQKELESRKNVILLGDNLGDLGMIEGFSYDNLIKIAFYNENNDKIFNQLKSSYDVIIQNDGNLSFVYQFIEDIVSQFNN